MPPIPRHERSPMVTETAQYITTEQALKDAASVLQAAPVVAMDLEADSMHHFEEKVCLIQLATDSACFIADPLAIGDMSPLAPLFSDGDIVKVLHGADYDVRSLYRDFDIRIDNLFDTEVACRFLGYPHSSLEAVVKRHFDVELDKKFQKKDWSVRPLPQEMIDYAADDVRYLVDLYHELTAALVEKGRLRWLFETCDVLRSQRPGEPDGTDRPLFMGIKGAGRLDPRSLAVLENLAVFRREAARKKDRPPYKIMNNSTLLALAREKPGDAAHLGKTRILSKKQFSMYAGQILRAIGDGLALADDELPRYPKNNSSPPSKAVTRRINALKKWREKTAAQLEMDPAMLINNAAITQVAKLNPGSTGDLKDVDLLKTWQIDAFGDQWIKTLSSAG